MPIFKLTSADDKHVIVMTAKCLSCARNHAAENAGSEGPRVWRDPSQSTCVLVRDGTNPEIIHRSTRND